MGSLTETFAYLREGRKTELDIKNKYWYITITPELKRLKRKLKLHLKENENDML